MTDHVFNISDPEHWPLLKKRIKNLNILDVDDYRDAFIMRRVESRLRINKINSYWEYIRILEGNDEEKDKLFNEFAINVSNFFRDKSVFEAISGKVLPAIVNAKAKDDDKTVKIWSAGCCSGEEVYSVAILLKEFLGKRMSAFNIMLFATDIDANAIEKAKEGVYEVDELRETKKDYVAKYFKKEEDENIYKISEDIKKMVNFNVGDIKGIKQKNLDLVLCRNTVIYFSQQTKNQLYLDIYNSLNQGGFFVMGRTETLTGDAAKLFKVVDVAERIYQKP
ncbi:protein-glutamate O-methyltransferase CheR [Candidatus Woesearchaeota archaeon]|nr:protein-glutamate O-methyltransferase CheR [Candidatus Woesearchaeota archaeon]